MRFRFANFAFIFVRTDNDYFDSLGLNNSKDQGSTICPLSSTNLKTIFFKKEQKLEATFNIFQRTINFTGDIKRCMKCSSGLSN